MPEHTRFPREAWIPLAAGLSWLWIAQGHGWVWSAFTLVPGVMLLGGGVALLLWPGDRRITHYIAFGGVVGGLLAVPGLFVAGFWTGLALMGLSAWSFVAAGGHAARAEPPTEGVPEAAPSAALSAQVAADEALLATMVAFMPFPGRTEMVRIAGEVSAARQFFDSQGWLEKPADYHVAPPALESPNLRADRLRGVPYDHISFDSGYRVHPDEPGGDRWHSYAANRTAHAWVLRHREADRPWLVCIHGYQMGLAGIDLLAFPPDWLHYGLGMNLLVPVLPLHGLRKAGRRSGDGFLTGEVMDSVHAEAQAMWDIRRLLSWVRAQSDAPIGVLGYSLGGYNTALLGSLDDGLAGAIAGIPLTDIAGAVTRHGPPSELQHALDNGLDQESMAEVLGVVSPLALAPKVPRERRFIFGAIEDRLVPAQQVRDLWEHWERPRIEWYPGAHITFRAHPAVRQLIEEGLRESGLTV
jgi:dienelactone hydrolase